MHTYDSDDSDNFICDSCDNLITGAIFNVHGKGFKSKNIARSASEHYCYGCVNNGEEE